MLHASEKDKVNTLITELADRPACMPGTLEQSFVSLTSCEFNIEITHAVWYIFSFNSTSYISKWPSQELCWIFNDHNKNNYLSDIYILILIFPFKWWYFVRLYYLYFKAHPPFGFTLYLPFDIFSPLVPQEGMVGESFYNINRSCLGTICILSSFFLHLISWRDIIYVLSINSELTIIIFFSSLKHLFLNVLFSMIFSI